jgi:hypothetical protein
MCAIVSYVLVKCFSCSLQLPKKSTGLNVKRVTLEGWQLNTLGLLFWLMFCIGVGNLTGIL